MVGFLVLLAVTIAFNVLYEVLRPKPHFDAPTPAGLGDIQFPTIEEGRPIPWFAGETKSTGPAVTWYGDLRVVAITERVKTGLFSSTEITKGYRYYLGVELVYATGPADEIVDLWFDDQVVDPSLYTKTVLADRTEFSINAPDLFGGDEEDGGIVGDIWVYHGEASQDPDDYLEATIGANLPAYRNLVRAVIRGAYLGTSPYMKPLGLTMARRPNDVGLAAGDEDIDGDANAAAMIFDLMNKPPHRNGLAIASAYFDLANFQAVGATLKSESMGLSMLQDRGTRARDLVLTIMRHIDAMLFVEPTSGLLSLALVRQDYDPLTLEVFDPSNCTVESFSRPSWDEVRNAVRIHYTDREDGFREGMVQAQELASIEISGGQVNFQDFDFRGFSNAATAQLAVGRALAAVTYPLASLILRLDRSAWDVRPGDVRRLDWPPLGISGLAIRIVRARSGELVDGKIEVEAMEDVFGVPWTAYEEPPASGWIDPSGDVPALTAVFARAAPYEVVKSLSPGPDQQNRALVLAARGASGITKGYRVATDPPSYTNSIDIRSLTPSGLLTNAITESSTSIEVDDGIDTDLIESVDDEGLARGDNLLMIEGTGDVVEFVAFKTVTPGSGTIVLSDLSRGCLDSVPQAIAAGARVWFVSYGFGVSFLNSFPWFTNIRFQAFNNRSEIPTGSCPVVFVDGSKEDYGIRPYPSADVQFNGASYPASISGELTISWEHRDRLSSWSYADSGVTAAQETNVKYNVNIYGELGTLVHSEAGLTGKSYTYPSATEIAESGLGRLNNHLRVQVETFRQDAGTVYAVYDVEWEFDRV